jgi:hypothetical protein
MTALDDIRAEIMVSLVYARGRVDAAKVELELCLRAVVKYEAELEAHDRAVAAMNGAPARRNIAELVLAQLTDEPQTVEALAEASNARPHQVKEAVKRLSADGKAALYDDEEDRWVRVGGLAL